MNDYALAAVKAIGDDDGNGSFQAVLSTSALDRDGEVIETRAFDPLPESIPIYFEHDWMSGAAPVGRGVPYYAADGTLMLDGTFASTGKAQEVRALVVEGMVDAMSVGFLNAKREVRSGVRTVTKGDVFEGSLTAIPINTGAKLLAAKAFASSKAGARNSSADQALIQTIHDNATTLGAMCDASNAIGKAFAAVERKQRTSKAIVGSIEAQQERVRDALEDAYGPWCTELRGVLPDVVVFDWLDRDGDTYQQSYEDDGAVVTLTGDPLEVDVHEVIAPDADADREDSEQAPSLLSIVAKNLTTTGAADDAAATAADKAAAAAADPAADEVEQALARIRLAVVQAVPA